jgi:hypothetical protein
VVVSHALANRGIAELVDKYQVPGEIDFLLTGILPEDELDFVDGTEDECTSDDDLANVEESFFLKPEPFTRHVIKRASSINKRLVERSKKLGVLGIYGSARYASIERGDLEYTGAGISGDGKPYVSEGELKHSTRLSIAAKNCTDIVVGHMISDHPNGPVAGLESIRRQL